jgi:protein SCO1/2
MNRRFTHIVKYSSLLLAGACLLCGAVLPASAAEHKGYKRTVERYAIPDVTLVNQNGDRVGIKSMLGSDRAVIVDFISGSCTSICPLLSSSFADLQQKLGADSQKVHLVSISIDPENDTPKVMKEYLKRYRAGSGWDFYTGSREDVNKVMRAFNSYVANKMYHFPVMLIRAPKDDTWVRISGLTSSSELLNEYKNVSGL